MGNKMSCGFNDLCKKMKPKPKVYTYEWVLKKKRVWCHKGNPCGSPGLRDLRRSCPSGQGDASPQGGYSSPQALRQPARPTAPARATAGQTAYNAPVYGGGSGQIAAAVGGLSPAPRPRRRGPARPRGRPVGPAGPGGPRRPRWPPRPRPPRRPPRRPAACSSRPPRATENRDQTDPSPA